jgi:hypothetical protein
VAAAVNQRRPQMHHPTMTISYPRMKSMNCDQSLNHLKNSSIQGELEMLGNINQIHPPTALLKIAAVVI